MIDATAVAQTLRLITNELRDLTAIAKRPPTETITGRHQRRTERLLEQTIGRMIETNTRVITGLGQAPPRDDYTSFVELGRVGILSQEVADRLAGCAELRTQIIHAYAAVDAAKIHDAVETIVADGAVFLTAISQYLESRPRA